MAHQGLNSYYFAQKLHNFLVCSLGKLCTRVYNLVKESAFTMTLLNMGVHNGGHSNSREGLESDALKPSFLISAYFKEWLLKVRNEKISILHSNHFLHE